MDHDFLPKAILLVIGVGGIVSPESHRFRYLDSFRVFDNVYVLTGAGAGGNTTTMSIYIYEAFFRRDDIGVAVAASIILLVLSFIVLAGILRLSARRGQA